MPNPLETSFIPKQPLLKVEGSSQRKEPVNVALVAALIVFFVTVSVAGGLFYWKNQIVKTVAAKALALEEAEKTFNMEDIKMYKRLQTSLDTAKKLVDEHMIFSVAFDLIEEQTAKNIGLTSLQYAQKPEGVMVSLSGEAPSYGALYFQVNSWKKMGPTVKSVELSTFMLDEVSGVVDFTVDILFDPIIFQNARVLEIRQRNQFNAIPETASSSPLGDFPANLPSL